MNVGKTLFAQLMEFVPWKTFGRIVDRHQGDAGVSSFYCADVFRVMAFSQLTWRESLRDIHVCLGANPTKLFHMGLKEAPASAVLADALNLRDWRIYQALAMRLIARAQTLYGNEPMGSVESEISSLSATVYALDSSTIDLCLSVFDWAPNCLIGSTKAAVKLHTLLHLRLSIPTFTYVRSDKMGDVNGLEILPVEAGAFYVMDRGYVDFARLYRLHQAGSFFVTRAKRAMRARRVYSATTERSTGVICDQRIRLTGFYAAKYYPEHLRRVRFKDPESGKTLVFLTNNMTLTALQIARAQEFLDSQMLLDPFEEQLHLPSILVERGDLQGRERHVVGQKDKRIARLWVFETDTSQVLGIVLRSVEASESNALVADDTGAPLGGGGVHPASPHPALRTGDEERARLMQTVESCEIDVRAIHYIKRAGLDRQDIEHIHVPHLAVADVNERGNRASQVQKRMHLDRRLGGAEGRPAEHTQTQIDGARIERVNGGAERADFALDRADWVVGVERLRPCNQVHRKRLIDAPIAQIQGVGKRCAGGGIFEPHVKELGSVGHQTNMNIPQRLAPSQLRESQDAKNIGTAQTPHARVAMTPIHDAPERLPGHKLHKLCEQRLSYVHASIPIVETGKHRKTAKRISNRGHP